MNNIKDNSRHLYPTEKQRLAIECPYETVLYGGAKGGGKTESTRFKILQHAQMYGKHAKILFLRQSLTELEPIIMESLDRFRGLGVWKEQKKTFIFNNGAFCMFNYLEGSSAKKYQGHEYTLIIVDEVGQFDSLSTIDIIRGCLRSPHGVPCQLYMTCNPGGVLHNQIKAQYIDPAPLGMTPIEDGRDDKGNVIAWKVYIPATLFENPALEKNRAQYINSVKKMGGSPEMIKALLYGDWSAMGGDAFGSSWNKEIHVMRRFRIPDNWRVIECYDDGQSAPWACVWFAISDGSDYILPNGELRPTIKGDIFVISELYGWNGRPNEGTNESTRSKASKILAKEEILGYKISRRIADSAMFSTKHNSIADEFASCGVYFERCDKSPGSRIIGANLFRHYLLGAIERKDNPGIFFFDNCVNCIRTIPTLPRAKDNMDDVQSTHVEDHCLHGDTIVHTLEYGDVKIKDLVGKKGHCLSLDGKYEPFYNCKQYGKNDSIVKVYFENGDIIKCTPDHKFLTLNGLEEIQNINCNTEIEMSKNGCFGLKTSIIKIEYNIEYSDTYCLTVPTTHVFAVNSGIIVSNCYDCLVYNLLALDKETTVQNGSASFF